MLDLVDRFRQHSRFLLLYCVCAMESSAYRSWFSSTDIVSIIDFAVFVSVLSTIVILLYYMVQILSGKYHPFLSISIFKSVF